MDWKRIELMIEDHEIGLFHRDEREVMNEG